jgi:hypothetical protein
VPSPGVARISPAPANGAPVVIYRQSGTPGQYLVNFTNAIEFSGAGLNLGYRQGVHRAEEAIDTAAALKDEAIVAAVAASQAATRSVPSQIAGDTGKVLVARSDGTYGWSANFTLTEGTGALAMTGALSAASASLTGALTAASASLTGALTATSASLTGALTATSASLTGALTASSASLTGALTATSASLTGALTATSASLTGALTAGGTITAPRLAVDATAYLTLGGSDPILAFDANDYLFYTRGLNTLSFVIGGSIILGVNANTVDFAKPVALPADPASALHAVTKQYVDARVEKTTVVVSAPTAFVEFTIPSTWSAARLSFAAVTASVGGQLGIRTRRVGQGSADQGASAYGYSVLQFTSNLPANTVESAGGLASYAPISLTLEAGNPRNSGEVHMSFPADNVNTCILSRCGVSTSSAHGVWIINSIPLTSGARTAAISLLVPGGNLTGGVFTLEKIA